jgi:hypothetical protein
MSDGGVVLNTEVQRDRMVRRIPRLAVRQQRPSLFCDFVSYGRRSKRDEI